LGIDFHNSATLLLDSPACVRTLDYLQQRCEVKFIQNGKLPVAQYLYILAKFDTCTIINNNNWRSTCNQKLIDTSLIYCTEPKMDMLKRNEQPGVCLLKSLQKNEWVCCGKDLWKR